MLLDASVYIWGWHTTSSTVCPWLICAALVCVFGTGKLLKLSPSTKLMAEPVRESVRQGWLSGPKV